jgi:H+/Cl- antiporter ClcA
MRRRREGDEAGTGLYLAAALVGTLAGLVGGAFHALLDAAERGRSLLIAALADSQVPGWLVLMVLGPLVLIPAQWLVRRLAPETAGSGIPEVEAALAGRRSVRWPRVLPIKFLAGALAVVARGWVLGQGPALPVQDLPTAPLASLPLFLLLRVLVGVLGVIFDGLLLGSTRVFQQLRADHAYGVTAAAGLVLGALLWWSPQSVGGGETLVESLIHQPPGVLALILLLTARTQTSVGSYGLGLPGGIFAPMLALGTIAGTAFDLSMQGLLPALGLSPGLFAVAAMGARFAATVRAPWTGTVLTAELTGALDLVLPITLTCLSATFAAEALGSRPVYGLLLVLGDQPPPPLPRRRVLVPALGLGCPGGDRALGTLAEGYPGQAWLPVLIGDYITRDEAQAALERLPDNLQRLGPIIRTRPAGVALVPPR